MIFDQCIPMYVDGFCPWLLTSTFIVSAYPSLGILIDHATSASIHYLICVSTAWYVSYCLAINYITYVREYICIHILFNSISMYYDSFVLAILVNCHTQSLLSPFSPYVCLYMPCQHAAMLLSLIMYYVYINLLLCLLVAMCAYVDQWIPTHIRVLSCLLLYFWSYV